MNQLTFLLFFFFTLSNSSGQSLYSDYKHEDKTDYFFDSFNDNSNNWETNIKYGSSSVNSGYYYLRSKSIYAANSYQSIDFDTNSDFEIETSFRKTSGKSTTLQSLIWGCSSSQKNYFGFTGGGNFRISWYDGTKYHAYKDWTTSSSINTESYNRLTIRKVKSLMYFFINKKRVYTMPFKSFFGDRIGFQVPRETNLTIKYLRISLIKIRNEEDPTGGY
jgi:hypothetical protein